MDRQPLAASRQPQEFPMPITVEERHQSRKAGDDWREYGYIVTGTDSEDVALAAAPGDYYPKFASKSDFVDFLT
jgi:hypothetical protein